MRKKIVIAFLAAALGVSSLVGCSLKQEQNGISASAEREKDVISAKELLSINDYDVDDYVELGDYKNIEVTLGNDYNITNDNIEEYITYQIDSNPAYKKIDKQTIEDGDCVNLSYTAIEKDGDTKKEEKNVRVKTGDGLNVEGLEESLIGKNVGDTYSIELTFPEDYGSAFDGKTAEFEITINSIDVETDMSYDKLTDWYVKDAFGVDTVKEYKKQIKQILEERAKNAKRNEIRTSIMNSLTAICPVEVPDDLQQKKLAEYKNKINKQAESVGKSVEDYLGISEDSYKESLDSIISENVRKELILEAIIKDTGFSVKQSDFDKFVSSYIKEYGLEDENVFYEEYGGEKQALLSYAEGQVLNNLIDEVTVTEQTTESN